METGGAPEGFLETALARELILSVQIVEIELWFLMQHYLVNPL